MVSTLPSANMTNYSQVNIPWFAQDGDRVSIAGVKRSAKDDDEDRLPVDPRVWTRSDVQVWVEQVCWTHQLPIPEPERFMMNGKAMCLMSASMFTNRVPLGGKTLYRDFQIRLAKAINM